MTSSFYGEIYSARYDNNEERFDLLDFYLDRWRQAGKPEPVLEPMCGTGFFLIPFIEAGADIDGLDTSPHMITACQKKCDTKKIEPALYEQTIEEMNLPRQYGFMFIPDRTFGHVYEKDAAQTSLNKPYDHLLPGGWWVLDVALSSMKDKFGSYD